MSIDFNCPKCGQFYSVDNHHDRITGVVFSNDGRRLMSLSSDGTVIFREADPGE